MSRVLLTGAAGFIAPHSRTRCSLTVTACLASTRLIRTTTGDQRENLSNAIRDQAFELARGCLRHRGSGLPARSTGPRS